ncbi:hypothetical protein ACFO5K_04285 [Nocardia halotolerans]|uniref:Uncharacterized protein n=1 Tax=Nocardia halotolerans TaxID=1755878 RepID=A0ABV8VCJ6_9NOCA
MNTLTALTNTVIRGLKAARKTITRRLAPQIVAHRNGPGITNAITAGDLVTITTHLENLGVDTEFAAKYASALGRKVAPAYRARTGREPLLIWKVNTSGYPIQVRAYSPTCPALTEGVATYKRTTHLVAA